MLDTEKHCNETTPKKPRPIDVSAVVLVTLCVFMLVLSSFNGCIHPLRKDSNHLNAEQSKQAAEEVLEDLEAAPSNPDDMLVSGLDMSESGEIPGMIDEDPFNQLGSTPVGEAGWIEVSTIRIFSNSKAPDDAYNEILNYLRTEAVTQKIGTTIDVTSLLTDMMSQYGNIAEEETVWTGFFRNTVSGLIISEQIIQKEIAPRTNENGYRMTVALRAFVVPAKGQRDPTFQVEAELDNTFLHDDDELVIYVAPSLDCYVYIFNLLSDHNAILVFPNAVIPDNYFSANQRRQIPDPESGISFTVSPLPGKKLESEFIYIVCSKQQVSFTEKLPEVVLLGEPIRLDSDSFCSLQRWLLEMPLSHRKEVILNYHVGQ